MFLEGEEDVDEQDVRGFVEALVMATLICF